MLTQNGDYMIVAGAGGSDMVESNIPVIIDSDPIISSVRPATTVPDASTLYIPTGPSARMKNVRRQIEQIAGFATSVLLTGESGTGKAWVARHIHEASPRRDRVFVTVDCAAVPGDLIESELFGHEKGAFPGAISTRMGRIEAAQGGTLFLNGIADLSLPVQAKLAHVLEHRAFERVGSERSRTCDFRLIAATHRDLEQAVGDDVFREDLYFKLKVYPIEMPPLRERIDDLTDLIERIEQRCAESGLQTMQLTPGAIRVLKHYDWPGNIAELTDLVERLCVVYPGGRVDIPNLPRAYATTGPLRDRDREDIEASYAAGPQPQDFALPNGATSLKSYLETIEIALIRRALHQTNGVIAHAARKLRIRRTTLAEKMKRYAIRSSDGNADR
jgi:sigma-54 specific flagellar transcriptional regulator A